jgi:hypothetical protein|tara:strand:- start:587 stop:760 length:174 start_codon:yes stop_codon:yes gene_type:complete
MKTTDAIAWFGSRKKMADALGIWPHATYRWGENPPMLRQFEIERLSDNELKAENKDG